MANILQFTRNRCTSVERIDEETMRASCRLRDTLTEAFVEIMVRLPDLEIIDVKGEVLQTYQEACTNTSLDALRKIIGIRIGAGMLKMIKGLIGGGTDCKQLVFMVEECCHGVILSFTKEVLITSPRPKELQEAKDFYAKMLKENIRLYNRCAAFAPGSSLVEGVEPPGQA